MSDGTWQGKTAVVTGGANGIGLAMVQRFASAGMRVVIADRDATALDAAAAALRANGAEVLTVVTDVCDPASVDALAAATASTFGNVHVLCNNAGTMRPGRAWDTSPSDWSAVMAVNVEGVVNGMRSFVPAMLAHGEPSHVVNTASGAGLYSAPGFAAYCASKAAVIALTEQFAEELALEPDAKVRAHVLCPGSTTSVLFQTEVRRRAEASADDVSIADPMTKERWAAVSSPARTDQVEPDVIVDALWQALHDGSFYVLPIQSSMRDSGLARITALDEALRRITTIDGGAATGPNNNAHNSSSVLLRYFATVDGPTPSAAVDLLAEDLHFEFARPDGAITGGRAEMAQYLAARRPLQHRIDHHAATGQVELAVGQSMDGDTELGAFLVAQRADDAGRIVEYLASFHPGRTFSSEL